VDRRLPHDTVRNVRFFIGILNAAKMGIFSAGQHPGEIDTYLVAVNNGLIVQETRCDKGMQDNFALRAETTVELATT